MEIALLIENIKKENEIYLAVFQTYLNHKEISNRFLHHAEYYLNAYLADERQMRMASGVLELHHFFMDYFYGNYNNFGVLASEELMEKIIESLQLFYCCMHDNQYIDDELYTLFEKMVEENKTKWLDELRWNENFDQMIELDIKE